MKATKVFISILVTTLFVSTLFGQVEFSVELIFQDADGNTDTLIVGYDDRATFSIDADLGEENIGSPWDAVFEVRVTNAQTTKDVYDTIFTQAFRQRSR